MSEEKKHCKWYNDEFCTNGDSPCVADYCPVVEYPELCKCRELDNEKELTDEEIANAFECCNTIGKSCNDCPFEKNGDACEGVEQLTIDLIHRLQGNNAGLQKQIEEQRKIIEYQDSVEERNAELQKQVDELTEERANLKAEIATQKLKFEALKTGKLIVGGMCEVLNEVKKTEIREQSVKDTAKEILQGFMKWLNQAISDSYDKSVKGSFAYQGGRNNAFHEVKELVKKVAESKGVEVE